MEQILCQKHAKKTKSLEIYNSWTIQTTNETAQLQYYLSNYYLSGAYKRLRVPSKR